MEFPGWFSDKEISVCLYLGPAGETLQAWSPPVKNHHSLVSPLKGTMKEGVVRKILGHPRCGQHLQVCSQCLNLQYAPYAAVPRREWEAGRESYSKPVVFNL